MRGMGYRNYDGGADRYYSRHSLPHSLLCSFELNELRVQLGTDKIENSRLVFRLMA